MLENCTKSANTIFVFYYYDIEIEKYAQAKDMYCGNTNKKTLH